MKMRKLFAGIAAAATLLGGRLWAQPAHRPMTLLVLR